MRSAPPAQRLFTPDRLLPSYWADREGAERKKCDARRVGMKLGGCEDKNKEQKSHFFKIGCDATKWMDGTGCAKVWGKKKRV